MGCAGPAAVRAKVAERFRRAFREARADDADTLGRHLEICLWNWAIRTCGRDGIPVFWECRRFRYRYTTRALSLDFNLRDPRNPDLVRRVADRRVGLKQLVGMLPQEMFPQLWEPVYQRVATRQLRRMVATTDPENAPEGAYTCGRCKSRKTVYTSMQTRSADEPMTVFVTCLSCGKNWKD